MRVPLPQSCTASVHLLERRRRIAAVELGGQARQVRAEGEHLDAGPRADGRVQEQQQRARVRVHRARDVARAPRACAAPACARARAARPDRRPCAATGGSAGACRAGRRAVWRRRRRDARRGRALAIAAISRRASKNSSGVISPKSFSRISSWPDAPSSIGSPPDSSGSESPTCARRRLADAARDLDGGTPLGRHDRRAHEPRGERAVEQVELVLPRDERLAQREVDVLLAVELRRRRARAGRRRPVPARPRARPRAARVRRSRRAGRGVACHRAS